MSKAQDIVQIFQEWLDGYTELSDEEQDQLIGESEWYALEMKILIALNEGRNESNKS